jgi:hypothetical protein
LKKFSLSEFNTFINSLKNNNFNFLIHSEPFTGLYNSIHNIKEANIFELYSSNFKNDILNIEKKYILNTEDKNNTNKNIIFINDIHNIKEEDLLILIKLLKHNKINNSFLENTIIIATVINEDFLQLSDVFSNLFITLEIKVIFIEWIEQARITNQDWRIISFLKENNNFLLFDNQNQDNMILKNYPSPYTWNNLSTLIKSNQNISNIDLFSNLVNGCIGEKTGDLFIRHVEKLEGLYFFKYIFEEELDSIQIIEEEQITNFYLASNFYFKNHIKELNVKEILSYFKYTDVLLKSYPDNNDIIFSIKSVLSIIKEETENSLDIFSFIFESGVFVENDTILSTISNYMKK